MKIVVVELPDPVIVMAPILLLLPLMIIIILDLADPVTVNAPI